MKINLREISEKDTPLIIKWRNKEFVKRNFIYRENFTEQIHNSWMNNVIKSGSAKQFIIVIDEEEEIGSVFLKNIDFENKKAEFGIFIGEKKYIGKGFGKLATKKILEIGFNKLELNKIYLRVLKKNETAIRTYNNCGFVIEGEFKQELYLDCEFCDLVFMAILREDYILKNPLNKVMDYE